MRYRKLGIGVSLFLVVSTVLTWLVFITLRREVQGPTNTYAAMFTDVSGLKPGDDVRVAGVRVGRVDRVELAGKLAKVTFRVQRDQTVYDDTTASVTYQNIIGQRYVGLAPGQSPKHSPLADGQQIPVERTRPSFDISNLLNGFEPLFSLLNPQQVDNLTNGLILALQGDSGSVLNLITQTSALAQTLAGPDAVLGDLINNLNDVTGIVAGQTANIRSLISSSRDVMVTLANRREELLAAVGSINTAVTQLAAIMAGIYPRLQELITREPGFVAHVTGPGRDRLSMFGTNLISVWKDLARASQSGAYMDAYLCDINSTIFASLGRVIPGIVKLASPGNVVQHSPICSK
ncbi:MCE family protein [Mycolicibacterium sp. 050232]|uniref:MCE family protein n=1 Tax=Mycolicibacterium sp. 050232 TaxID=3113982 RepID=UPI002E2CFD46|nr:MCE family protein [Mycolicibacterium sp. 050232]MED5810831.1 MCE family protein [Mycolicibacterium sp. 050232]